MVEFNKLVNRGIERSVRWGLLNQIRHGLDIKFPMEATTLFMEIQRITSIHALKMIENRIYHLKTAEELRQMYRGWL